MITLLHEIAFIGGLLYAWKVLVDLAMLVVVVAHKFLKR